MTKKVSQQEVVFNNTMIEKAQTINEKFDEHEQKLQNFRSFGPLILVVGTVRFTYEAAQVIDVTSTNSCQSFPTYPLAVVNAAGGNIGGFPMICGGYILGTEDSDHVFPSVSV